MHHGWDCVKRMMVFSASIHRDRLEAKNWKEEKLVKSTGRNGKQISEWCFVLISRKPDWCCSVSMTKKKMWLGKAD